MVKNNKAKFNSSGQFNPLTPNDHYSGRTAPLTSKFFILYIYSTNIGTEYFKHGIYSPWFPLQIAVCFIILTYLVPVLFTFYIQGVLKLKKNNSGNKRLSNRICIDSRITHCLIDRKQNNCGYLLKILDIYLRKS